MDSTRRFSDRVEDYVRYRPHYPAAILGWLGAQCGFVSSWVVADVGSGRGISRELFWGNGNRVYAVEPNKEMREKAEELLKGEDRFVSVEGTAEATGLPDGSVDLVVAGQAFHWFEPVRTRAEWMRIVRPGGYAALIWNERRVVSPFEQEYEELIRLAGSDYKTVNHRNIADLDIEAFFRPASFVLGQFENEQFFDFVGLKGRLLSSSYIPKEGMVFEKMLLSLRRLFDKYAVDGKVRIGYDTKVFLGVLYSL